ncbi:MAG: class I SAM-dependent methyltransferase [Candidatus Methylomirabilia bacterium]
MQQQIDQQRVQQFAGKLLSIYTGSALTKLVDIGYQTGLFEAAAKGPGTSQGIAERAGLNERYVREWLGAMTTGGIFAYDAATRTFSLPPEHAALLTGDTARNFAPMSQMLDHLGKHLPELAHCFRHGGGVSYSAFRPEFTERMDDLCRRIYDDQLISGFLGAVGGIQERLKSGVRVADIGCGSGHAVNLMAREYPDSRFVGYDIADDAIAKATAEAGAMGLSNSRFQVLDVTKLPAEPKFDLITAFDAVHDQVDPAAVLGRVSDALAPEGTFLMIDFKFSSNVEENIDNPFAPLYYGVSVMHCMTVSLAEGGAGLGTVWGEQLARRMLAEAGFSRVEVVDCPRPQNSIYICRK